MCATEFQRHKARDGEPFDRRPSYCAVLLSPMRPTSTTSLGFWKIQDGEAAPLWFFSGAGTIYLTMHIAIKRQSPLVIIIVSANDLHEVHLPYWLDCVPRSWKWQRSPVGTHNATRIRMIMHINDSAVMQLIDPIVVTFGCGPLRSLYYIDSRERVWPFE